MSCLVQRKKGIFRLLKLIKDTILKWLGYHTIFERKKVFFRMSYVPLINAFAKQCPTWFLKVYESLAKSKTGTLYNSSIKALHHKYVEKTRWCIKKVHSVCFISNDV